MRIHERLLPLLFFIFLVDRLRPAYATTSPTFCPPGYTGNGCALLKFAPKPDIPSSYLDGAIGTNFTTWGGSIVRGINYYFMLAETFGDRVGVECWGKKSAAGILKSSSVYGPWELVGFFGYGNLDNPDSKTVPYAHDLHMTIEQAIIGGKTKYALTGYVTLQQDPKTNKYLATDFGTPTTANCGKFPASKKRPLFALYKELSATTELGRRQEVESLLLKTTFVTQINGYKYSGFINNELKWYNLIPKIPNPPIFHGAPYVVNPDPLKYTKTNQGTLIPGPDGQLKRLLITRINEIYRGKIKEYLMLLYTNATGFIWDSGMQYYKGPVLRYPNRPRQEDGWFTTNGTVTSIIFHDLDSCGKRAAQYCGMLLRFNHAKQTVNIVDADQNDWGRPQKAYDNTFPGLSRKATKVQRPMIWFDQNGDPEVFYGGWLWKYSKVVANNLEPDLHGGSRAYPVRVLRT